MLVVFNQKFKDGCFLNSLKLDILYVFFFLCIAVLFLVYGQCSFLCTLSCVALNLCCHLDFSGISLHHHNLPYLCKAVQLILKLIKITVKM